MRLPRQNVFLQKLVLQSHGSSHHLAGPRLVTAGRWQLLLSSGLIAKENVVATFGQLFGFAEVAEDGSEIWEVTVIWL